MPAVHDERLHRDICVFAMPDIEFVGSRLNAKGLHPLQFNVEAVLRLPEPAYPAQVASFLGMMAYYLCFLPQYLVTTAPVCELLKDTPRVWTPACSDAVQQLKVQLTLPPVLRHFDLTSPMLLTCEASSTALGAVQSRVHNGAERPVTFTSRAFISAEQKYSVGEWEALACICASELW